MTRQIRLAENLTQESALHEYYRKSWALVIGINDYGHHHPKLANAVHDAEAIAKILKDLFSFDSVILLFDVAASRDAILECLKDTLPSQIGPDDRFVFFFACHGTTRKTTSGTDRGYLIPYNAQYGKYVDYIDMSEVKDACSWVPAKHILIILDCCFSGIAAISSRSVPIATPKQLSDVYLKRITEKKAWQVLTAGATDDLVADSGSRPQHSAFTSALLSGLEGLADQNSDGIFTASDLAAYIKPIVTRESVEQGGRGQTPFFNYLAGSEQGDFVFFRSDMEIRIEQVQTQELVTSRFSRWTWIILIAIISLLLVALVWQNWFTENPHSIDAAVEMTIEAINVNATKEAAIQATAAHIRLAMVTNEPVATQTAVVAMQTRDALQTETAVAVARADLVKTITISPTLTQSEVTLTSTNSSVEKTPILTNNSKVSINVRSGPSTDYPIIGELNTQQSLEIIGKYEDNAWMQVDFNGVKGWVFRNLITTTASLESIPIAFDFPRLPTATPVTVRVSNRYYQRRVGQIWVCL